MLKAGGAATFAGYAVGVEKAFAQVVKTDTTGITAGDFEVKIGDYAMPVYEARPASGGPAPIVVCISEVWGVHEWVKDVTRRFAKAGYYAVAPELFKREGGVAQLPNIQDILKIVLAVPRKQLLGDVAATIDWAKERLLWCHVVQLALDLGEKGRPFTLHSSLKAYPTAKRVE
jgi:carboxymethylenebutenolidase